MSDLIISDKIVLNASGDYREDYLDERLHLVVNGVAIAEGVWEGSQGAVFYPAVDLRNSDAAWDHKPVVLGHPAKNGKSVSAADATILNSKGVGLQLHTKTGDDGRQRFQAWIDVEKANRVDERIVTNIRNKKKIEVSTGLFAKLVPEEGEWNGKPYKYRATDFKPDHLALLLDEKGAYSVADGGGLLANAALDKLPQEAQTALGRTVEKLLERAGLVFNKTMERVKVDLYRLLADAYGKPGKEWYGWIEATFEDKVVFYTPDKDSPMMVGYKVDGDTVTLVGTAVEVQSVHGYRVPDGSVLMVNRAGTNPVEEIPMPFDKNAHLTKLIGNGGYSEADREWLAKLDDAVLEKVKPLELKPAEEKPVANAAPVLKPAEEKPAPATPVVANVQQYIASAPPEIQAILNSGLRQHEARKQELIANIKASPANAFTDDYLAKRSMEELEGLSALASFQQQSAQPVATGSVAWGSPYVLQNNASRPRPQQPAVEPLLAPSIEDDFLPAASNN